MTLEQMILLSLVFWGTGIILAFLIWAWHGILTNL